MTLQRLQGSQISGLGLSIQQRKLLLHPGTHVVTFVVEFGQALGSFLKTKISLEFPEKTHQAVCLLAQQLLQVIPNLIGSCLTCSDIVLLGVSFCNQFFGNIVDLLKLCVYNNILKFKFTLS